MPELKSVALPRLSDKIDAKFEKEVDKVNDTATGQKGSYEKCKLLKGWYPYGGGKDYSAYEPWHDCDKVSWPMNNKKREKKSRAVYLFKNLR